MMFPDFQHYLATGFLFVQNFVQVSDKLASIFFFGGSFGGAILPTLAVFLAERYPRFFHNQSPNYMNYLTSRFVGPRRLIAVNEVVK